MKLMILSLAFIFLPLGSFLRGQENESAVSQDLIKKAVNFVSLMTQNDFTSATADFDSTMSSVMPASKLEEAWNSLISQAGPFKEQTGTRTEEMAQYNIIYVQCSFEKAPIDIKVVFDRAQRIAGLFFAPSQGQQAPFEAAAYVDPKSFRKSDVTVGSGEWKLPGTLTIPWGVEKAPAVVLVHGSGPNDRDETIGPNKPFRDIAEGLSSKGIAVLRYDKRTKVHATQMLNMLNSLTVKEETIDDALAAVALLRQTPGIDTNRIFVLGHSLGATLIPRIGKEDPEIAGFIVMAGITRPLEDVIVEQFSYIYSLKGEPSADEKAQLDTLKAQAALVKSASLKVDTPPTRLPLNMPARYWLDLRNYKPAEMAKGLAQPMLIMQGLRDYQVTMADFDGWKNALSGRTNVEFKTYPAANHLFIDGEGKITPEEYGRPGHVSEKVISDIADWIKGH